MGKSLYFKSLITLLLVLAFGAIGCTKKTGAVENSLQLALSANVKGMDPIFSSDLYSNTVNAQIYDALFEYHYLKRPLELQPLLAESMPEVSKDGLTYTIKIKKGVKFHDSPAFQDGKGRELKAADFIYSWKRLATPTNNSDGFWIFDGKIKGFNEWREALAKGTGKFEENIEGLQTPDDYTIVIKLREPYYQLLYVLAMVYAAPVAKEAVEKYGQEYLNHPVGTGPFYMTNWVRNNKIELARHPHWHGQNYPSEGESGDKEKGLLADAGKPIPFVDKIVFQEIIEDQPRWLNFMKGNLDTTGIPKDNFDSAIKAGDLMPELKGKGLSLYVTQEPDVTYTSFNLSDPNLKNSNVRKAMALAGDTKTLIEKFYNGRAIPAQTPVPPGVDGYDPNFKNPYREQNLEKAKEYLAKAGFPEGKGLPEFEYATTSSATARQMAEFFQQNMANIGVKIKITTSSWPQFTEKLKSRKGQIWGIAWSADYPDAENFLQLLFGPNSSPGPNNSNFKNEKYDTLYKQAKLLPPGEKRTALYKQMKDIFVEEMPWIPETHRLGYRLGHEWISNYKPHAIIQNDFKYVRVDGEKRATSKSKL
jgi:oligopeptide transport system substrate-binding protein